MNALAHNTIAQTSIAQTSRIYRGAWKLAVCASLALVITMLSARLINHSVVQAYLQAVQATPAVQLSEPLAGGSAPVLAARWNRI